MKNASEGETLGIYLEDEGEGEICRGTGLSKGGGGGGESPKNLQELPEGSLGH
jgi:hypothetical protein